MAAIIIEINSDIARKQSGAESVNKSEISDIEIIISQLVIITKYSFFQHHFICSLESLCKLCVHFLCTQIAIR